MTEWLTAQSRRLRGFMRGPNGGALFVSLLALTALLSLWWLAGQSYQARLLREARAEVVAETSLYGYALSAGIHRRFARLEGLAAFVQAGASAEDFETKFGTFAAELYADSYGVRNFAVAPGAVVRYVYPLAGNEVVAGHDLINDPRPDVRADVQRAIQSRVLTLSGPYELQHGGLGLVARLAVYQDGAFWGLVTMVLDIPPILEESGLGAQPDRLDLALRDRDGGIFFGPATIFDDDSIIRHVELPEGSWELAAMPIGGWQAAIQQPLLVFQVGGLIVVALVAGVTYLSINRQARLALDVQLRTQEVALVNQQLEEDIARRKQVESELRQSDERYRALARNFPNGAVFLFDRDLRYTLADGAGLTEVGLSKEMLEGKTIREILPPDTVAQVDPHYRAALAGKAHSFEASLGERVYLAHTLPLRDERGDIFAGMAVTQDITERKRAEEALRRSQQQYEQLVNSIDGIVWEGDAQTFEFSLVSRQAERILGYPAKRWVSEPTFWKDHIYPDDRDWAVNYCVLATAEKRVHEFEYRMFAADGRIVWLRDIVTVVVEDDEPKLLRGLMIDITERRQAEQALQEKEQQYRSIFEATSDGLVINDLETGVVVEANPAFCHMNGYSRDEIIGLHPTTFIHPHYYYLFGEYLETVRAGGHFRAQAMNVRKDGTPFHVEVHGTSFMYKGKPHVLGVVRDITEQVQAQHLLEQRVEERTRELRALLDISYNVVSTLELKPLIRLIFDQLKTLVDYRGAGLFVLQGEEFAMLDYQGPLSGEQLRLPAEWWTLNLHDFRRGDFVLIPDTKGDAPLARKFRGWAGELLETTLAYSRTLLAIPLASKESIIGLIGLTHDEPDHYTEQHISLVTAIANQIAVAIENARLFTEVQDKAILEERQRLARDLHDSVTQSLYSLTLLSEAGRRLAEGDDVEQATQYLRDIGEIAEQALKEMRLLVYQLRPSALEQDGIIGALQTRLDSVEKRAGVDARFLIEGSLGSLPPTVEEGLFRIAQEALNNALKHASARTVLVRLRGEDKRLTLEVSDDGRGVDLPSVDAKGGLGLTSMNERAAQLGGTLTVHSAPGEGTRVVVEVPRHAAATT